MRLLNSLQSRIHVWTSDEFNHLIQVGALEEIAVELLDGAIVDLEEKTPLRCAILSNAQRLLWQCYHGDWVVCCQTPLRMGNGTQLQPDVMVVQGTPRDYLHHSPDAATLVVKVAESALPLDQGVKSWRYGQARVEEYWIINLVDEHLEVYRRQHDQSGFAPPRIMHRGEQVTLPGLKDVTLAVSDLLP